jgi:hypothetical protein
MTQRPLPYWLCLSMAYVAGILPYAWTRLFGYRVSMVIVDFAVALGWVVTSSAAFYLAGTNRVRRWLPMAAGPFALWPAAVTAFTLLVWKLHGFAR